jgi:hypothetical protein
MQALNESLLTAGPLSIAAQLVEWSPKGPAAFDSRPFFRSITIQPQNYSNPLSSNSNTLLTQKIRSIEQIKTCDI